MQQISAAQLAECLASTSEQGKTRVLLDVREPWEFERCHIPGALSVPMNTIPSRLAELDPDAQYVCICHHGMRSMQVAAFLESRGYTDVINLAGGVDAWAQQVDPSMARY